MQPTPSHNLKCRCGSIEFLKVIRLRWGGSGGMVEEYGGMKCAQCLEAANSPDMIARAKIEAAKAQIREIEGSVGGLKDAGAEGSKV